MRGAVSLTGQLASVDEDLTGRENLILLGRLLGLGAPRPRSAPTELLEAFGLAEAAGQLVKHYSGGMRRRLDIAASIVVTPELMFLDEPTTGLDPRSRNQVWDIIRALVGRRHHDPAVHAVPRGGRPARRRDRRDRPRQGDRRGHARPAQGVGRLGRAARAPARPGAAPGGRAAPRARARARSRSRPTRPRCRPRAPTPTAPPRPSPSWPRSGVRIADFSLGQPSLDEVFLALTGHPAERRPTTRRPRRGGAGGMSTDDATRTRTGRPPTRPPSAGRSSSTRAPAAGQRRCRPRSPSAGAGCSRSSTCPSSSST